jgi:outer membrane receptor protein involved in Fe transport
LFALCKKLFNQNQYKMRKLLLSVLYIMLLSFSIKAQTTVVTGKITDATGDPVPNASVVEKGTKNGVVAENDGSFSIKVKSAQSLLVISALGFELKQVTAGSGPLSITLSVDTKTLNEVVVTGTGVATSKRKLGISVESVTADKLPPIPAATLDQALVGKIPGAQISTVSGNPGDKVNIVLRGINSVQGGTRPLVMLDGVEIPFENLTTLDLGQVERVEVVQGAASATIYGAQGANGVIQIFSKKGAKGRMSINVSSSYAHNSFINAGDFGKADKHPFLT